MEVILREDIDKLGSRGEMVKVASGYARNFLLPRRLAVAATESNKKIVEQERQAHLRKEAKVQAEASDLAKLMSSVELTIAQKAGENDQLFGSVTANDVALALEKAGYTIDRRKVHLDDPIKTLGDYKVSVRLHREVTVDAPVHVVREEKLASVEELLRDAARERLGVDRRLIRSILESQDAEQAFDSVLRFARE